MGDVALTDWIDFAPADRLVTMPSFPEDWSVPTLGIGAVEWMRDNLIQPDGPNAGQPFKPSPDQIEFLLWFYALGPDARWLHNLAVRRQSKGKGKALALDTRLPTPDGWTLMGDVEVGDELLDESGAPTFVTALSEIEVDRDCYRVEFRDGTSVVADSEHLWPMDEFIGGKNRRRVTVTTRQMFERGVRFARPLTSGSTKARSDGVARWRTLPTPSLFGSDVDLPIPGYLLGYWLGDGDSDCPRLTVNRDDVASVVATMDRLGIEHGEQKPTGANTYRIGFGKGWAQVALRSAGLLGNKHIPPSVMRASHDQRLDVLRGLLDSDGTIGTDGMIEFCSTSERLAVGFVELARTLGLYPRLRSDAAKLNGRVVGVRYRVSMTAYADEPVFLLARKAGRLRQRPKGVPYSQVRTVASVTRVESTPVRCVTVSGDSSLYLAGEGMVPTHNSPFAAALALFEFVGPARLDRFDDRLPWGCVGKPVAMPLVQIVAAAESQTKNTMRYVRAFCPKNGHLAKKYDIDVGKTQFYKLPEGSLEVITSSFTAAEGAQATFAVGDEPEHWTQANQGHELNSTILDNLTKTGGRMVHTCNAWKPGIGSVAEATWDDWLAQEEGKLRGDQRILYDARVAPPLTDEEMGDRSKLMAALEHCYEGSPWVDLENVVQRIWRASAKPDDSKRKYLNQPTAPADAWLAEGRWGKLADPTVKVAAEEPIVLFFDGSKSRDATAIVACRVSDGFVFVPRQVTGEPTIWEPDTAHDTDDVVPVELVDLAVDWVFERHNVVAFFADVQEWESFVKIAWPKRHGDKLKIKATPTGKQPETIAWDMRSKLFDFTREVELVAQEIDDGLFTHDGNAVVARHIGNMRRHPNRFGVSVGKESPSSAKKIDAGICVIGARMVRRLLISSGYKERKKSTRKAVVL